MKVNLRVIGGTLFLMSLVVLMYAGILLPIVWGWVK